MESDWLVTYFGMLCLLLEGLLLLRTEGLLLLRPLTNEFLNDDNYFDNLASESKCESSSLRLA